MIPTWHAAVSATMPPEHHAYFREHGGSPFPPELVREAAKELDALSRTLEREGVQVRRPDVIDHSVEIKTPEWSSKAGCYAAMPRDVILVVGEELIEAPMAWRCRLFESTAYRSLMKSYFRDGAKWTTAPRPQMSDELYQPTVEGGPGAECSYIVNEFEPVFDAADFLRFGTTLVAQRSNVTNHFGIEWLRRHLGSDYEIKVLDFADDKPMHIDATIMPLAAGRLLVNPDRVPSIPSLFNDWEILEAPPACGPRIKPLYLSSNWISMNVLSLDERRVIVEASEKDTIAAFKRWGFEPIPCEFKAFNAFGGSFHCATVDVRRRGSLETYF